MIRIFATRVPDAVEAIGRAALLSATAPARGARLRRIRNERARERAAVADLLARWALGEFLHVDSRELHLARDSRGRPFLPGAARTHLSLTHSGEWAACAVGRAPLGIDVEREIPLEIDAMARILSPEEARDLSQRPRSERLRRFYELWTLKESYVKAVGLGWKIPPDSFTISIGPDGGIAVHGQNARRGYHWRQYRLAREYPTAVCAREEVTRSSIGFVRPSRLREFARAM